MNQWINFCTWLNNRGTRGIYTGIWKIGLQMGYTKQQWVLCLWNSRNDKLHYDKNEWPMWSDFTPGRYNVSWSSYLPYTLYSACLRILLWSWMKMVKNPNIPVKNLFLARVTLRSKLLLSNGPEIRILICDALFQETLSPLEKNCSGKNCSSFKNVLGNYVTIENDFF